MAEHSSSYLQGRRRVGAVQKTTEGVRRVVRHAVAAGVIPPPGSSSGNIGRTREPQGHPEPPDESNLEHRHPPA